MTEKKNHTKNQTKAGMMDKASENESAETKNDSETTSENSPKISKEKAAERDHERPIH
jgi:hypothetical protein